MQLVAGILRRDRLPKGPRDIAKLLADNDVAAAPGWSVPQGLEQVKRLSAAHLADRDAVQAQSQRRADEIGQRGDTVLCAQCHQVGSGAPKLPRILDEDDADRSSWPPRRSAFTSVVLPVDVPPARSTFWRPATALLAGPLRLRLITPEAA
jgi:hypothetical protein